jgi:hypothetical protein
MLAEHMPRLDPNRLDQAMSFLRKGGSLRGLRPEQIRRIGLGLEGRSGKIERRRLLVPVLAGVGLILAAGTSLALVGADLSRIPLLGALLPRPTPIPAAAPSEKPAPAKRKASPSPEVDGTAGLPALTPPPAPLAPSPADEPSKRPLGAGAGRTGKPFVAAASRPTPVQTQLVPSTIAEESRSFAAALEIWHRGHDPRRALEALDAHERRFPNGEMSLEIRITRAEVFLALGQMQKALDQLDPLALVDVPRARQLRVIRGELRIKVGRCGDAKADLAGIAQGSDALARRAAQALSACP